MKLPDPEELDEREKKLYSTSIFLSKMVFAGLLFRGMLFLNLDTFFLQEALTGIVQQILAVFSVNLERQGVLLIDSGSSYIITQDCLGWKSMAAFTALVFASSEKFSRHLKFLGIGLVFIAAINIFRVVTTVYLSYLGVISFKIIHTLFWKWGLTILVLLTWFLYFRFYSEQRQFRESLNTAE